MLRLFLQFLLCFRLKKMAAMSIDSCTVELFSHCFYQQKKLMREKCIRYVTRFQCSVPVVCVLCPILVSLSSFLLNFDGTSKFLDAKTTGTSLLDWTVDLNSRSRAFLHDGYLNALANALHSTARNDANVPPAAAEICQKSNRKKQ